MDPQALDQTGRQLDFYITRGLHWDLKRFFQGPSSLRMIFSREIGQSVWSGGRLFAPTLSGYSVDFTLWGLFSAGCFWAAY